MCEITRKTAPRALRRGRLPDPFTASLYSASPYRGCAHACRYCDGRAEKYYVQGDFEREIEVRSNLPELLAAELAGLRDRGAVSLGSGVTDAYQPAEAGEGLTGDCAKLLAEAGLPLVVLTKSDLILRDLPLWRAVAEKSSCLVLITITTLDERVRAAFEPGAPSSARRLEVVRELSAEGIPVGVLLMPLLPYIGDGEAEVGGLLAAAKQAGAVLAAPGGLTLRPGRQKDLFLETLAGFEPSLGSRYRELYSEERPSGAPVGSYTREVRPVWKRMLDQLGLPFMVPHSVHRRLLGPQDSARVLLCHMGELYAARGVPTGPLKAAAARYDRWLAGERTAFRRRRTLPRTWLEDRYRAALSSGEMEAVLGNRKLAGFLRRLDAEDLVFDYVDLEARK
jgi:DNA repair photolyase